MSARSTPKHSWNNQRASSYLSLLWAIWYCVSVPSMIRRPGFGDLMYGVFPGTKVAYVLGEQTRPRWPCSPPPSVVCTAWAFALISFCSVISEAVVGSPIIHVRSGYSKMLFLKSTSLMLWFMVGLVKIEERAR